MAEFGLQEGYWAEAEGRLYYAVFHATLALLLTEGVEPKSRAGAGTLLGQHFVRTGVLGPEDARLLARMRQYRMLAEYSRDFLLDGPTVEQDRNDCRAFVDKVRTLIAARGALDPT